MQDASRHVAGILVLGAQQSKVVNHAVWNLLKGIGAASAIGLVFATTLGLFAVRRTLRPLEDMSHEVESIQETDDLSKRLSGRGPRDEVGRLAEGFDRMLGRLQEAFMSQRRFLSDASHELRTPMTVVRGQLELLAMDVESLPGRRSMSIAIEELDRMGRIVEDLLLLARLDEGMTLARDSVEVELVVGEALLRAMLSAGDVRVQVAPELCILGDADRLLQVLTNLVTNAVRHGRNAPISVRAWPEGDYVKIEVADRGPGISPEDLPHVFERLYRGSKARSESPGGAGLGLAIAASLVKAMDGWIGVASTLGLGTTFTVTLPGAAPVSSYRMPIMERKRSPAV
jgi:two-component system OmpR family sensor kinase